MKCWVLRDPGLLFTNVVVLRVIYGLSIFILVAGFTFGPSFRYRTKSVFSQEQLKIQHLAELLNDSEATAERLEE